MLPDVALLVHARRFDLFAFGRLADQLSLVYVRLALHLLYVCSHFLSLSLVDIERGLVRHLIHSFGSVCFSAELSEQLLGVLILFNVSQFFGYVGITALLLGEIVGRHLQHRLRWALNALLLGLVHGRALNVLAEEDAIHFHVWVVQHTVCVFLVAGKRLRYLPCHNIFAIFLNKLLKALQLVLSFELLELAWGALDCDTGSVLLSGLLGLKLIGEAE